jgi:uncharacterized protein YjbI with pentapeptide repeats
MHGAQLAMGVPNDLKRSLHPLELVNLPARLERIEPIDRLAELVHIQPKFIGYQHEAEDCDINSGRFEEESMSESKRFDQEQMRGARFSGCGLAQAEFDDVDLADSRFTNVNLRQSSFTNINLEGAKLTDVNLAHVNIDNANIIGLTILGWNIADLIKEAQQKKSST